MRTIGWDTIRVTLHVLAATVWVGGQVLLGALVPVLRTEAPQAIRPVARRFGVVAWWAFAVLLATGVWNVLAEWHELDRGARVVLAVKLTAVVVSGGAALMHQRAEGTAGRAITGALSAVAALAAVFLGVVLAG
jgi:putative copper export protein